MIKCVTFDITNTLIRVSGGNVGLQYSNIIKNNFDSNFNLNIDLANKNFRSLFKTQNNLLPGYGYSQGVKSKDWWLFIVKNIIEKDLEFKKKNAYFDDASINKISNLIFDEFSKEIYWQKYSNCDSVLEKLKNEYNLKLGVISNFDERLFKIILNLKLNKYFDFICIPSNSNGSYKPQKEIFDQAFRHSKLTSANQILHVGDNIQLDYIAALNSNFNSVLLVHISNEKNNQRDKVLETLPEYIKKDNKVIFNLEELFKFL